MVDRSGETHWLFRRCAVHTKALTQPLPLPATHIRHNFSRLFHPRVCRLLVLARFRQLFAQPLALYQRADVVVLPSM